MRKRNSVINAVLSTDTESRNKELLENEKLIYEVLHKKFWMCNEDTKEEMIYAGIMGLIKAISTYNGSVAKKSTYYYSCIRREMNNVIRYKNAKKRSIYKLISLDTPISETVDLGDMIAANTNVSQEVENKIIIEYALDQLKKRNNRKYKIIEMYYGLNGHDRLNMNEIAEELDITHQRAQQLKELGIKIMQEALIRKGFDVSVRSYDFE